MALENTLYFAAAAAFVIFLFRFLAAAFRRDQITAAESGLLVEVLSLSDLAAGELVVTNGSGVRLWNVSVNVYELRLSVMNLDDTHMPQELRDSLWLPWTDARNMGPGESVRFPLTWDVKGGKRMMGSCFAGFSLSKRDTRLCKSVRYVVRGT